MIKLNPSLPARASLRLLFSKNMTVRSATRSDLFSEAMVHFKDCSYKWTVKRLLDPETQTHYFVAGVADKSSYSTSERFAKIEDLIDLLTSTPDHSHFWAKRTRGGVLCQPSQPQPRR